MLQLRALLPLPVAQPVDGVLSPASTGPGSVCQASPTELVGESPRRTRRAKRRMRPVHVVGHRLVTFRSSRFRIFGCTGGGGLRLSASVAPSVSGSEWYWSIIGSSYSGVNQCGCASP